MFMHEVLTKYKTTSSYCVAVQTFQMLQSESLEHFIEINGKIRRLWKRSFIMELFIRCYPNNNSLVS